MVQGTPYTHMNQVHQNEEMYGTLLSDNIIGVVHDHYINFRLDMDVDGTNNSFVRVEMARQDTTPGESPRKSYLKATRHVAITEKDAQVRLKLYDPAEFHIVNPTKTTRVGNPVAYKIVPAATAASLLNPEDPPQKRAAFTNNQVKCLKNLVMRLWSHVLATHICNEYIICLVLICEKDLGHTP
jgi:primary-amine oxidase